MTAKHWGHLWVLRIIPAHNHLHLLLSGHHTNHEERKSKETNGEDHGNIDRITTNPHEHNKTEEGKEQDWEAMNKQQHLLPQKNPLGNRNHRLHLRMTVGTRNKGRAIRHGL